MSKFLFPVLLIVCGVLVIIGGQRRADSVAGVSATVGTKIANAWDGQTRLPDHIWYYVGGGALILAGLGLAVRKR